MPEDSHLLIATPQCVKQSSAWFMVSASAPSTSSIALVDRPRSTIRTKKRRIFCSTATGGKIMISLRQEIVMHVPFARFVAKQRALFARTQSHSSAQVLQPRIDKCTLPLEAFRRPDEVPVDLINSAERASSSSFTRAYFSNLSEGLARASKQCTTFRGHAQTLHVTVSFAR